MQAIPLMYDIVIAGNGLTGACLAYALRHTQLRIAIVDPKPIKTSHEPKHDYRDMRSVALSFISRRIFSGLDLWQDIAPYATAIKKIHVSDKGHFGFARISAQGQGVNALGYVVELDRLQQCLQTALAKIDHIDFFTPAKVIAHQIDQTTGFANVTLDTNDTSTTISAKLVIAADGGQSKLRQLLAVDTHINDYQQVAIVANIGLSRDHQHIAYERFTKTGPLALLPLGDQCSALVWTLTPECAQNYLAFNDEEFVTKLQQQFGYRLGKFIWVGQRQSYPLKLIRAKQQAKANVIFIGNASHNLHPVAGQGLNLGLRDVAVLAQLIAQANNGDSFNYQSVITEFQHLRDQDQQAIVRLTDGLVRVFSNDFTPLAFARNLALVGLDLLPFGKRILARKTMGFIAQLPRLGLGLSHMES